MARLPGEGKLSLRESRRICLWHMRSMLKNQVCHVDEEKKGFFTSKSSAAGHLKSIIYHLVCHVKKWAT